MNHPSSQSAHKGRSFASLCWRVLRHSTTAEDSRRMRDIYRRCLPPFVQAIVKRLVVAACLLERRLARCRPHHHFERPFQAPALPLAAQRPDRVDYFVFGNISWHFQRQRPQHLCTELAGLGHRVFFISPLLKHADRKGFEPEALDAEGRLFSVRLHSYLPSVNCIIPDDATVAEMLHSAGELLRWTQSGRRVFLVEHPAWHAVVSRLPDGPIVYDCMDYMMGFKGMHPAVRALEDALFDAADLTVVTSQWLYDFASARGGRAVTIIRNAGEYAFFSRPPAEVHRDPQGRRTLGYYGIISDRLDLALLERLAGEFSDCRIMLVGRDNVNAAARLKHCPNVFCRGEVPYAELPSYLYSFDVCLLPLRPIPLSQATNSVKVYEYLGSGRPVVASDIPEMEQFRGLVYTARDHDSFVLQTRQALTHDDASLVEKRRQFARGQTWRERVLQLQSAVDRLCTAD